MLAPPIPLDEHARLDELLALQLLDSPPEERFDRLTRLARHLFGVQTALVSLVDRDRQWFKSRQGLDASETPRDISFCGHAILQDQPFLIEDASKDVRFADNPLVMGAPHIRFYAGIPLRGPGGYKIGTLCLLDPRPRQLNPEELHSLTDLAVLVGSEIANKDLNIAVHKARESALQLRQITDAVPALIAYLDRDERFRFHNRAYREVFGLSDQQIDGQLLSAVLGDAVYAVARERVAKVLGGESVHYERQWITPQGQRRQYAMDYFPRFGDGPKSGEVIGFFSLGTDITELKRIDRMKTEFVSTVSHELRTPLTSIRGSLGLIAGGVAGTIPEPVRNLVGIAKSNCERLIRLINDLLDSEKIESGKMRLDLQPADVRPLIQQALSATEGFAAQHRVKLALQAPDEPVCVRVDADRLTQVVTNLVSNAAKFSPAEGTVEVRVMRQGGRVRVEVVDHGPGIPEEFRSRIFQKFSQADASDARQKNGTGLGLNISRALVEKMGGSIGFHSEVDAGSTFFFELPEWTEPAAPEVVPDRLMPAGPRILICDGDADVAKLISMMLEKAGFVSDTAHDQVSALQRLATGHYDAVTVDMKLAGPGGTPLLHALRTNEKTRDLPVIVISAQAASGELQLSHKPLAVSDWLEKPIDENHLVQSVRRAIAGMPGGKPVILHVEDDLDVQQITAFIAQDLAEFEFVATLAQARARLRDRRFDLVLLDLALGDESGWALFEDIDKLNPRPPVIVFSASDAERPEGTRPQAMLVKAATSNEELLTTIQNALRIPAKLAPAAAPQS